MIKVLLIDDEELALDYLKNIINWEYYNFKVVGSVTDVEKALRIYRKYRPDLIISDVKMPGMSGIEFASIIRENDKDSHILFMSGYKDFTYVKQAIRLGIDDYLLKSDINEEVFLKKILQLKKDIKKQHSKNKYTMGKIFKELFQKNIEEVNYKHILDEDEYIRTYKRYYYLILTKKTEPRFMNKFVSSQINSYDILEDDLKRVINEGIYEEEFTTIAFFPTGIDEYVLILDMQGNIISQSEINSRFYHLSRKVFNCINKNEPQSFSVYYYPMGSSVRQFGRKFNRNKEQLLGRFVEEEVQVIKFKIQKEQENHENTKKIISISADEVYQAIKSGAREKTKQYVKVMEDAIGAKDYYTYLWYLQNLMEAMSRFEISLIEENSRHQFFLAESNMQYNLSNPSDIIKYITNKLELVYKILNANTRDIYSQVIIEALDYIQKNYMVSELSANDIAMHVNLSNSWLSTKFKDEVGVGVCNYLNSIRIQKAKQLFDQEEYMIYEVAEKTGFTSSQYFSRTFKQLTGVTPNEYKRNK